METVTYLTPEKNILTDMHEASITVVTYKLDHSVWIEDEFAEIVAALAQRHKIKERGKIPMQEETAWWLLYHNLEDKILNLEFYIITDGNVFFKITYSASDKVFNKHRSAFEKTRESFFIKRYLW